MVRALWPASAPPDWMLPASPKMMPLLQGATLVTFSYRHQFSTANMPANLWRHKSSDFTQMQWAMRQAASENDGLILPSIKFYDVSITIWLRMHLLLISHLKQELTNVWMLFLNFKSQTLSTYDLHETYAGKKSKFDPFWIKMKEFLEEDVGTAADDHRHSQGISESRWRPGALTIHPLRLKHIFGCSFYHWGKVHVLK